MTISGTLFSLQAAGKCRGELSARGGAIESGAGQRSYLAIRGGFDLPPYMGSRATFTLGQFGGHAGRTLRAGDVLRIGAEAETDADQAPAGGAMPAGATPDKWGDVNCDGTVNARDALAVLAWPDFELPHPNCEDIGHVLT